jgi:hypothetical protein
MASKRQELVDAIVKIARVGKTEMQVSEFIITLAPLTTQVLEETLSTLQSEQTNRNAETEAYRQSVRGQEEEAVRQAALYQEAKEIRYFFQKHPEYGGNTAICQLNEAVFRKALPGELLSVANMQACLQMPHVKNQLQVSDEGARRQKLVDGIIELLSRGNSPDYLESERKRLSGETMPYLEERFRYLVKLKTIEYDAKGQKRTPSEIRQVVKPDSIGTQSSAIPPELTRKAFAKCTPDEQRKNIRKFSADRLNEHWRIQEGRI